MRATGSGRMHRASQEDGEELEAPWGLGGLIPLPINESKLILCSRGLETQGTLGGIVLTYL